MRWAPWELGTVGIDANMYAGQRFHAKLPAGVSVFPLLELMSPPLELEPLTLESPLLETMQPFSAWAPL